MVRLVAGFFILISLAAAAGRPGSFYWKGKLAPGLAVEIVGVNGDVRAEYSDSPEVEILAHFPGEDARVNVALTEHEKGVTACAVFPKGDTAARSRCAGAEPPLAGSKPGDLRVNFTVRVPKGVNLIGRTVNGELEANRLESNVTANTVNGRIRISTSRSAEAHTVNGSIAASLHRIGDGASSAFSTVNGSITLQLPASADTRILAETINGRVSADFPLKQTARRLDGRIGSGSSRLKAKTVNGSIQVKRAADL